MKIKSKSIKYIRKPSFRISNKKGLPPGALVHIGERKSENIKLSLINYNEDDFSELQCDSLDNCEIVNQEGMVNWVDVDGLHDISIIEQLGKQFGLHPLLLEDVLNTGHRPKMEEFDDYLFVALKALEFSKEENRLLQEHISLVMGDGWVISFQEKESNLFDVIQTRIREGKGNIRKKKADYLLYRIIDITVDNYFVVTEDINDTVEELEENVLENPDKQTLKDIQNLKKQVMFLRKAVIPLREAIMNIEKSGSDYFEESTQRYLLDLYEHIIQVSDSIDTLRDMLNAIMDLYFSGISNRTNQVMQVLTIISTIFIPLTFIAGIYGMNFDIMPELHWQYGYFVLWGVMAVIFIVLLFFFKRKKWL